MNLITQLKALLTPQPQTVMSPQEQEFVRRLGGAPSRIRYCGRSDLVGLKVIGQHYGIRVEQAPSGRYVRLIRMVRGREVLTEQARPLRVDRNKTPVIETIKQWVD